MKRIISLLLAVAFIVACAPVIPITAKAATSGYYTYSVSGGEATIIGCNTSISGDITIPATLGGYPVTSIGDEVFYNCSSLTSVVIPDSVASIGDWAFQHCSRLKSVAIPDSVTSIGAFAFDNCSSLTSVTIPDSVTSIGVGAFSSCSSLTSVTIPDGVTSISYAAFSSCSSLTSIEIPDSVTYIEDDAFSSCSSLTSVVIGDSVTSIGASAFHNCRSLTSVVIPDSVASIGDWAFWYCSSLTSVVIGDSVTSISYYAFCDCSSLTSITIPDSVTWIDTYAFSGCSKLKDVYYAGTQEQWNVITIGTDNEDLTDATIYYNHTHDYTLIQPVVVVAPTCTEIGRAQYTCIYGELYTEVIPALGHDYLGAVTTVAPTCTEEGYTITQCTRCEETKKTNYTAALGHDCPNTGTIKEPTCTENGTFGGKCTRCKKTITSEIAALGHSMKILPASEPTCTTNGATVGSKCERCDYYGITPTTIPATGHNVVNGVCTDCELLAVIAHKQGDTETYYSTMEEALAVTGGTIQLLADVTADAVNLNAGVTLDLNGYTLTANSVTGHVMDSTDGNGLVKVGAKNAALTSSDDQLILWDNTTDNSGYRVFNYSFVNLGVDAHKDDAKESKTAGKTIQSYWSDLVFTNPYAYTLAASGKSGLEIAFELSWTPEGGEKTSKTFQFGNAVVADWAQEEESNAGDKNYCFYIRVDGFEEIKSSGTVAVKPVLKTAFNSAETAATENRYNYQTPAPGGLVYEYGFGNLNQ